MEQFDNHTYFTKVYKKYHAKCLLFALYYTHDMHYAQDIVSEAMMVLWDKINEGEKIELPLPFLMSVVRNKVMQHFRRELFKTRLNNELKESQNAELELRISSLSECDPYDLYYSDIKEIINRSLSEMSEQTRSVFHLSRYDKMSNREIAEALGLGVKGVEYHITRALKKLRKDLRDYDSE